MGKLIIKSKKHGVHEVYYDDVDEQLISQYVWCINKFGRGYYAITNLKGPTRKMLLMHILIMGCKYIDHIDNNGLNNRRLNLRKASHSENKFNKGLRSDNKTGFKGVGLRKSKNRIFYQVTIKANHHRIHGGYFDNPIDAAKKYNELAKAHHGEFARLNKI